MKSIILLVTLIGIASVSNAQNFSGVATYETSSMLELKMDSTSMSPQQMRDLKQQLLKKLQKSYSLEFNAKESVWQQMESLDAGPAQASSGGMEMMVISNGNSKNKLYRNLEEGMFRNSQELMGRRFLIVDSLPKYQWKITSESKNIGDFNCQKAIYSSVAEAKRFATGMEEMEVIQDTTNIIAWFTMDIPVSHGPNEYYGLPGLILDLKVNGRQFICSEITMNYQNPEPIEVPNQGKKVNEKEFQAISDQKMQEMMERYQGNGEGAQIEIVVGG